MGRESTEGGGECGVDRQGRAPIIVGCVDTGRLTGWTEGGGLGFSLSGWGGLWVDATTPLLRSIRREWAQLYHQPLSSHHSSPVLRVSPTFTSRALWEVSVSALLPFVGLHLVGDRRFSLSPLPSSHFLSLPTSPPPLSSSVRY